MNILRLPRALAIGLGLFLTAAAHAAPTTQGNIANFSSLVQIPAGGAAPTLGFVVSGPKMFLVRAIGQSLTPFGIQNPAASPIIHIYDGSGFDVTHFGTPSAATPVNWPGIFSALGAFPLTGANDAYALVPILSPGGFSIQVTDATGKAGAVLIEVYDASSLGISIQPPSGSVTVLGP